MEHGLLMENLLDLAHAPFTHTGTFAKGWPVPEAVKFHTQVLLERQNAALCWRAPLRTCWLASHFCTCTVSCDQFSFRVHTFFCVSAQRSDASVTWLSCVCSGY